VHTWQLGSLVFFGYVAIVAVLPRGLRPARQARALAGAAFGAGMIGLSRFLPAEGIANVWVLPPAALLIGYWTSGLLFVAPMPRAERMLAAMDGRLRIRDVAARMPRPVVELLEFAYAGIYPLIPLALYLALGQGISANRFWATILLTDYICFAMLPWFQTRPPRAVGLDAVWRSSWRTVNLRMLAAGSVQVNTFPSGHAAEALACALLLSGGPPLVAVLMFVAAAAVAAGTVFGRYHYAADAIAGWAVALLVWGSLRS
jgi:membrane-associated phospholipid phosphatase